MIYTPTQTLSFEAFIAQNGDDARYELTDGELRSMEPTGPHESFAGKVGECARPVNAFARVRVLKGC